MSTPRLESRKRARTDDGDVTEDLGNPELGSSSTALYPGSVYRRDQEFWFDDGTIILVAREIEFRVYGGLLAAHSSILKDLFAQAHSTRTVVAYGQHKVPCPVVHLSDSPEDLRRILRIYMPCKETR